MILLVVTVLLGCILNQIFLSLLEDDPNKRRLLPLLRDSLQGSEKRCEPGSFGEQVQHLCDRAAGENYSTAEMTVFYEDY